MSGRARFCRGGAVAVLLMGLVVLSPPTSVASASPTCNASSPNGGAYTVTLCLDAPSSGATLSGDGPVSASVTVTGTSPGVRRAIFYVGGSYVLTDFSSPYTFSLRTNDWVDGPYTLAVEALMQDGFLTARTSITVNFQNGVLAPPVNTNTFTPKTGTSPAPGTKFRVAAVGDGPDGNVNATNVANRIAASNPNLFLYLGDVYEKGTKTEFLNWYGTQGSLFDSFRSITNPTVGNHEYEGTTAPGYFDYWDNVPDYYSYNAGGWHFVSINSTSQFNQTAPGSAQYQWLAADLAANTSVCTAVYFHHPVLSVGPQGSSSKLPNMWKLMADWGVDVALTGHEHSYQRWVPLDRNLNPDPAGMTQFVVGGGGHGIQSFVSTDSRLALGLDSTTTAYGALLLDLSPASATYRFEHTSGAVYDSGTIQCSGATPDTSPPTPPSPMSATALSANRVDLTWGQSNDDQGVTGYTIYRDGAVLTTTNGATNAWSDTTVNPSTTYTYWAEAFDAAGNRSGTSNSSNATTPGAPTQIVLNPAIDSYVDAASPNNNYGTSALLRADASPDLRTYLRFTVSGVAGTVTSAKLRLSPNANHSVGFRVHNVADNSWTETGIKYANAPPFDPAVVGSSGALTAAAWTNVDVTSLVTGNGTYNLALTTTSSTLLSLASRQSANPPQLVIDISPGTNAPPTAGAVSVVTVEDQATAWTPVVSDPDGDPLTCTIVAQPPRGTATVAPNCSSGTFTPAPNDTGAVGFTYRASDGIHTATASVDVTINPVNDAPVADPQNLVVTAGVAWPLLLTGGDIDGDCPLSFAIVTAPTQGALGLIDPPSCSAGTASAAVTYTPNTGYSGPDSLRFLVTDPTGASSEAVVAFTVNAPPAEVIVNPVADSYVDGSKPTTNYGTNATLRADASPDVRSYLMFNVTGGAGTVTRATLRLYANSKHSTGYRIHSVVDTTWTEAGLTYNNAPAFNPAITATSGALVAGTWKDIDITPLISGSGTYTIALTTTSTSSLSLGSRQSATPPQLTVRFGS